jgi:hypothetical protein
MALDSLTHFVTVPRISSMVDSGLVIADVILAGVYNDQQELFLFGSLLMPIRLFFLMSRLDVLQPILITLSQSSTTIIYLIVYLGIALYSSAILSYIIFHYNDSGCISCYERFGDMSKAVKTMFDVSSGGVGEVMQDIAAQSRYPATVVYLYFGLFSILASILFMNVMNAFITMIILDNAGKIKEKEQKKKILILQYLETVQKQILNFVHDIHNRVSDAKNGARMKEEVLDNLSIAHVRDQFYEITNHTRNLATELKGDRIEVVTPPEVVSEAASMPADERALLLLEVMMGKLTSLETRMFALEKHLEQSVRVHEMT